MRRSLTNKTGWNTARFEAWAASHVTAGPFTVAAETTTISIDQQRHERECLALRSIRQ